MLADPEKANDENLAMLGQGQGQEDLRFYAAHPQYGTNDNADAPPEPTSPLSQFYDQRMVTDYNNRNDFIKKVYGILAMQLSITVLFTALVLTVDELQDGVEDTFGIALACMILAFILSLVIVCCQQVAKTVPYNYIVLLLFTLCETYVVAYVCAFYDSEVVLIAACMTLGVTLALTIYAWTTKTDFTTMGGIIWVLCISLLLFGFLVIFFYNSVIYMIYCFVAVIIYGIFLIYDTQLIAGGRYRQLSYDDYIIGSLLLYIDIIGLFLYILSILGKK